MATSINLAPGTQYLVEARKRRRRLFIVSAAIVIGLILIWLGLIFYQSQLINSAENTQASIRDVDAQIAKLDDESQRIVLFEKRLQGLNELLNNHTSWAPIFSDLEKLLPASTVLTSLALDNNGDTITMTGVTPDIDSVASTLASLIATKDHPTIFLGGKVKDISRSEVAGTNGEGGSVSYQFGANLSFDPTSLEDSQ